jgi:L-methionine (R)-S-oxide reductase
VSQNALGRLHDLAVFVRAKEDLRTHLGELVELAASVTDAARIGVMNISSRLGSPPFDESNLRLAEIVATLIGKAVQVERLQTLIKSRVAQVSLAKEEKQVVARLTDGTVPPVRVAKLLAKSFFRDLATAGFDPGQIIEAASEIITLVSNDINRFKKRIDRETK